MAAIDDLASVAGDPTTAVVYLRDILKEQCCKCHDVDSILIALHAIRALGKLGNTAQSACPELDCAVAISSDLWPAVQDAKKNIFKKPTTKPTQADWQNVAKTVAAVQGDVGTLQTQANKLAQDVQQIVPPPMQGLMTDVNNLVQSTTALTIAVNNLATAINKVIPQQPTPPSE